MSFWAVTYWMVISLGVGILIGLRMGRRYSAEDAREVDPPVWWKRALIMAKARKEADKVKTGGAK